LETFGKLGKFPLIGKFPQKIKKYNKKFHLKI